MPRRLSIAVTAALVGSGVLAGAESAAHAAYPGRNGLIAFEMRGDIYTIKPATKTPTRITTDARSRQPRWSPDGKRIAFGSRGDIWVMNANGTGRRQVTTGAATDLNPTWSPDGKRVAFARWLPGKPNQGSIWTAPVGGGTATRLTTDPAGTCASEPAWSATGRYLVYQRSVGSCVGDQAIVLYDRTTKKSRVIASGDESAAGVGIVGGKPDFMPDGRHVLFLAYQPGGPCSFNAVQTDLAGRHPRLLTDYYGCEGEDKFKDPAAAPDGTDVTGVSYWTQDGEVLHEVRGTTFVAIGDVPVGNPDWQPVP